jgi:hypothetical protein
MDEIYLIINGVAFSLPKHGNGLIRQRVLSILLDMPELQEPMNGTAGELARIIIRREALHTAETSTL